MHSFLSVEAYYTQGNIYETIISILKHSGIDVANLTRKNIAGLDEFHIRGQEITRELAEAVKLQRGMRVLDTMIFSAPAPVPFVIPCPGPAIRQ